MTAPRRRRNPDMSGGLSWLARLWLLILGMLFGWVGAAWAAGQPDTPSSPDGEFISERAFWKDLDGQADFATARTQTYTPYRGVLSRGYTDSAHWIRLTLVASEQPLVLIIRPNWLDELTLYDPDKTGEPVTVGDQHLPQTGVLSGLGNAFILPAGDGTRQVWLRLQSTSAHLLTINAVALDQVAQIRSRQVMWHTLYASTLVLILAVLVVLWWSHPDRLLGAFLLRHVFYILYGVSYLGIPAQVFADWGSPAFFDQLFSWSVVWVVLAAIPFDILFLSGYKPQKHLLLLLKSLLLVSAGLVLLMLAGYTHLALQINALMLLLGAVVLMLAALSCRSKSDAAQIVSRNWMLLYYALLSGSLILALSNLQGWTPSSEWTLYGLILHGLVSGLTMGGILIARAQGMAKRHQKMTLELRLAEENAQYEKWRRQEQSKFLNMLTHEIKTPLAVIALALGTKNKREENLHRAGEAVRDMKAIIDRCLQADQLGELGHTLSHSDLDILTLIRQIAPTIPDLDARLQVDATGTPPAISTDPQLLQIVLTNLLHNAVRYSATDTPVQVAIYAQRRAQQDGFAVRVSNLPGLAGWPDAAQLFNKHYRASGAQSLSGSGLGLFLSRQLAQTLGGSLDYQPNERQIAFLLWMPIRPA